MTLGLTTAAMPHEAAAVASPLYEHIADLSANGMADRVWSVANCTRGPVRVDDPVEEQSWGRIKEMFLDE